ncbi:MAG TPA: holin family protein [Methanosarcina sp.]|nr:holin family protein [Methanosarcina sp.]
MDPLLILQFGSKLIDKFFPNKEDADKAKLSLLDMQQKGEFKEWDVLTASDKGQTDVNAVEAQSDSFFKSGWRPATGWVCVSGLFYQVVVRPILSWISRINGWEIPPSLELDTLMTLLFGMLGLGAYRTYEKVKK